ncbi:uncharacterized protein LOC106088264 [Stomoxys calcitrans]|uniref:uncharacterized protein LOC106088264 n=1 Tax=Stomoxys calcitrans TaxID=35570 RepID=UPI0027E2FABF|nr:uncharacterized protein LOC106088264 [Stomoxys calcitrans]
MSLYNADELTAPSWIDGEFLQKVLGQYENKGDVEILSYDMSPASMKGDHYASIMFRCKVNYRQTNTGRRILKKSLIIKTLPVEDGHKREMLMQSKLFETEIDMYAETLPKIEKILAGCGEPTKLSAGLIYHSLDPHKIIIFEDLCELGYDTVRSRFLTENEIKAVYSKLAKLHAVSYMLGNSENHALVTKYQEGIFSTSMPLADEMMRSGINNFIDMLSCYEEFDVYYEKIKLMKDKLSRLCKDLYRSYTLNNGKGDIFVLNHGDFHMKNMMFKFDKKQQMEDVMMVDYQISCYAPSNIDLVYSQFMMLSPELRLRRHELMQYYFTEFIRILRKINYQGELPLYSQFQMAGLKYRHFTVFLVATFLPMVVGIIGKPLEELKDVDTDKMFENPDMIAMIYRAPAFVEEARKILPILLREGYLD